MCGDCAFPQFEKTCHRKKMDCNEQYCCPLSWNNTKYGAVKGESCGTNIIYNRSSENLGEPIKSCINAGGVLKIKSINPQQYLCIPKIKNK